MGRRRELLVYAALIALALIRYAELPRSGSPRRPPAERGIIDVEIAPKTRPTSGTAFLISSDGLWATAAHVSDFCAALEIMTPDGTRLPVRAATAVTGHDLAVLQTAAVSAHPLMLAVSVLRQGTPGRHLGYPGGKAGEVSSRYIGTTGMRTSGVLRRHEVVDVWAEIDRKPASLPGLGGISGGPVIDGDGRVRGINSAATIRRGRLYTVSSSVLRHAIPALGEDVKVKDSHLSPGILPVICHATGSGRSQLKQE